MTRPVDNGAAPTALAADIHPHPDQQVDSGMGHRDVHLGTDPEVDCKGQLEAHPFTDTLLLGVDTVPSSHFGQPSYHDDTVTLHRAFHENISISPSLGGPSLGGIGAPDTGKQASSSWHVDRSYGWDVFFLSLSLFS